MSGYCTHCMEPIGTGPANTDAASAACIHCGCIIETAQNEIHALPPGTILANGRYLVGRVLGQGGFGITYIGRDLTLDMRVAVKEYYPAPYVGRNCERSCKVVPLNNDAQKRLETGRQRFLEEARVLAKFHNSPGIVDVRDFFEQNSTAYIVMDYLEGETLKSHLANGTIDADRTFALMRPILDALSLIHNDHVIHRDISPDNIMLCSDGNLRLMDFGAAREMDFGDQRTISMVLKSGYAPEEQYRAKGELGPWTDIYALCATMYRVITGVAPDESLQRLISDEMKWPSEMGVRISPAQEGVLRKGMAPRSADRYHSIAEMKADYHTKCAVITEEFENDLGADTANIHDGQLQDSPEQEASTSQNRALKENEIEQERAQERTQKQALLNDEPQHEQEGNPSERRKASTPIAIAAAAACVVVVLIAAFLLMPTFTISFDTNDGSAINPVTLNRLGALNEPATPTRDGFEFAGWYLDESLTDKAKFPLAVESNTTLHAAWDKIKSSYQVEYLDAVDKSQVSDPKTVENAEVGATVTEKAPYFEGYALDSDKQVKLTISENDSENNIAFRYRRLVPYEVRYRDKTTDSEIAPTKTVNDALDGTEVTEAAPDIAGYTLQSDKTQAITLNHDSEENAITFYYDAVRYEPVSDTDGGGGGSGSGGGGGSNSANDVEWAN